MHLFFGEPRKIAIPYRDEDYCAWFKPASVCPGSPCTR